MAAVVYLTVKQGGRQLKEREDFDLRPDETFNQLIARAIDVPDGAEITARLYPDARHLLALSANVKDLGVPVAPRAVHNPYICAIVTQPAPPPISEEEAEAKRKANATHTLSLLQSAVTRMNKLPVKHDTEKKLRAEHLAFNWVVDFLEREGLAFPDLEQNKPSGTGYRFALELSKLLTYIDGHTYKFADASCALPAKFVIEGGFRSVGGGSSSHKLPNLDMSKLRSHTSDVLRTTTRSASWTVKGEWPTMITEVTLLCNQILDFVVSREKQIERSQNTQEAGASARTPATWGEVKILPRTHNGVVAKYSRLNALLGSSQLYEPILIDDRLMLADIKMGSGTTEQDERKLQNARASYREGLAFGFCAKSYSYHPGGQRPMLVWVWRCQHPEHVDSTDETAETRMKAKIQELLPIYHTRRMVAEVDARFRRVQELTPAVVRAMRRLLSNDASAARTVEQAATEERVLEYICHGGDITFWYYLTGQNGATSKYDLFWEYANKWIETYMAPAVDERRHLSRKGDVLNASAVISIPDMLEQIKTSYLSDHPGGPPLETPDETFVAAAFSPSHPCHKVAARYSGKLNLCRAIQIRCLHKEHPDAHYNHALQRYRKYKMMDERDRLRSALDAAGHQSRPVESRIIKIDADDKTGVPVGDPGQPVSTSVRRQKAGAIVAKKSDGEKNKGESSKRGATGHAPKALDHDFHRATMTPAVALHGTIPDDIGDSWCEGRVHINLNDATFQHSTSWRHAAEYAYQIVNRAINWHNETLDDDDDDYDDQFVLPITKLSEIPNLPSEVMDFIPTQLYLSTDGGPDHNFTHLQVKCSLIALQRLLKINLLSALRCSPNGSYVMTAERVMPLLNLGLQNMTLERAPMAQVDDVDLEALVASDNSMAAVRERDSANKHLNLKAAWLKSMDAPLAAVKERFERISLKGNRFKVMRSVTEEDIQFLRDSFKEWEPQYSESHTCKGDVRKMPTLNGYLEGRNVRDDTYLLQAHLDEPRGDHIVSFVPRPWKFLSRDDSFAKYHDVVAAEGRGVVTDERYRPSFTKPAQPSKENKATDRAVKDANSGVFHANSVVGSIDCVNCLKPRLIFSSMKKRDAEFSTLQRLIGERKGNAQHYICGTPLCFDANDQLNDKAFVVQAITCSSLVQPAYHSTQSVRFLNVCVGCGSSDSNQFIKDLEHKSRPCNPLCKQCHTEGVTPQMRGKSNFHQKAVQSKGEKGCNAKGGKRKASGGGGQSIESDDEDDEEEEEVDDDSSHDGDDDDEEQDDGEVPSLAQLERAMIAERFDENEYERNTDCEHCEADVINGVACSFCNVVFCNDASGKCLKACGVKHAPVPDDQIDDWCCSECMEDFVAKWRQSQGGGRGAVRSARAKSDVNRLKAQQAKTKAKAAESASSAAAGAGAAAADEAEAASDADSLQDFEEEEGAVAGGAAGRRRALFDFLKKSAATGAADEDDSDGDDSDDDDCGDDDGNISGLITGGSEAKAKGKPPASGNNGAGESATTTTDAGESAKDSATSTPKASKPKHKDDASMSAAASASELAAEGRKGILSRKQGDDPAPRTNQKKSKSVSFGTPAGATAAPRLSPAAGPSTKTKPTKRSADPAPLLRGSHSGNIDLDASIQSLAQRTGRDQFAAEPKGWCWFESAGAQLEKTGTEMRSSMAATMRDPKFSPFLEAFLGGFGNKAQGIEYKRELTARALMNETAPFPCGDGYYGGQIESKALALFSQRTVFVLTIGHPTAVKFTPFQAPPRSTPISINSMGPRGRGDACTKDEDVILVYDANWAHYNALVPSA